MLIRRVLYEYDGKNRLVGKSNTIPRRKKMKDKSGVPKKTVAPDRFPDRLVEALFSCLSFKGNSLISLGDRGVSA